MKARRESRWAVAHWRYRKSAPDDDVEEDDDLDDQAAAKNIAPAPSRVDSERYGLAVLTREAHAGGVIAPARREDLLALMGEVILPWDAVERLYDEVLARDLIPAARSRIIGILQEVRQARIRLIAAYQKMVVWVARRYQNRGLPLGDLVQEGNLGLLKAVERFDLDRGHLFSTYATWWVRQAITRAIQDFGRTVRIPVHVAEKLPRLDRARREIERAAGRQPTVSELADALRLSDWQVARLLKIGTEYVSLDAMSGELVDECGLSPFETAALSELRRAVAETLLELSEREERILRLRFGIGLPDDQTLEEIGDPIGVTRERIRQIEVKALKRIRHPPRSRRLRAFLDG